VIFHGALASAARAPASATPRHPSRVIDFLRKRRGRRRRCAHTRASFDDVWIVYSENCAFSAGRENKKKRVRKKKKKRQHVQAGFISLIFFITAWVFYL
jgi:hypothetical protein